MANIPRGTRVLPNRGNRLAPQPPSPQPVQAQLPRVEVQRLQLAQRGAGRGRLRRGLVPSRGARGQLHQGHLQPRVDTAEEDLNVQRDERITNLTSLCESLQEKLQSAEEKFNSAEERFDEKLEEARKAAREKVEEENSRLKYKLDQKINDNLAHFEDSKDEKFKYKASAASIKRINLLRSKLREAVTEGERDFEDFSDTKTGKILQETLELLDEQEGLIRYAETSPHGYKILDLIEDPKEAPVLIKDKALLKKLSEAEKVLENEATRKRAPRRGRSRSRSRTRSRSPAKYPSSRDTFLQSSRWAR